MNWQDAVTEVLSYYKYQPTDDATLSSIEETLQNKYPGPYTVGWTDDGSCRAVALYFTNEVDVTHWLLRW